MKLIRHRVNFDELSSLPSAFVGAPMHGCMKTIDGLASSPSSPLIQTSKEVIFSTMDARYGAHLLTKVVACNMHEVLGKFVVVIETESYECKMAWIALHKGLVA